MRTRTLLTTPPGEQPAAGGAATRDHEHYSHGFAPPQEPHVPGRFRPLVITLVVVLVVASAAFVTLRVLGYGPFRSPSVQSPSVTPTSGRTPTGSPTTPGAVLPGAGD